MTVAAGLRAVVMVCVAPGLVGGCGDDDGPATAVSASARVASPLLVDALAALLERTASGSEFEPALLRPDDVGLHPLARVESLEFMALVTGAADERYSVYQRIDRIALRPPPADRGDLADFASAGFRADAVARYAGTIAMGARIERRDMVERVTLGLATFATRAARVRDVDVELVPLAGAESICRLDYTVADGLALALRFRQSQCGTVALSAGFATGLSATLDVNGELESGGERISVVGKGWLRRGWGEVPAPGGAIVFDRLVLELDGVGQLDALRSKRRSGRGPMQTTASVAGRSRDNGELLWLDDNALSGVAGVPRWRLIDVASGIDIELVPVTALAAASRQSGGPDGHGLRTAVAASGTHAGVGFVDIVSIAAVGALE